MKELEYPFNSDYILKKRRSIKKELMLGSKIKRRIAILGGSTTHDIKDILELFLLNYGIEPEIYESEYAQYWQDVMFDNEQLLQFKPDIIYVHTSTRNIQRFPSVRNSQEEIDDLVDTTYNSYMSMWDKISKVYNCPIIQNNFEPPAYRLLGNRDASDMHGHINFINRLNELFYHYAQMHDNFFINDINYLSSCFGIQKWSDPFYWHMYKYACALPAIPELAFNISNIIKSIYGKNKKALVLDLDNTLWGGVVGDDGPEKIEIGQETSVGQIFSEFQDYIKAHKDMGVILNINSKNDIENAMAGLERPDCILKPDDFIVIMANWESKDKNLLYIANELNIGIDSLVFVDDNPAERYIVKSQFPDAAVPEIGSPEQYIQILDRSGFFEMTNFSEDDLKRNDMYQANAERTRQESSFENYEDYLSSLEMKAIIRPFESIYMSRISQLTNKSNQYNLTTRRCSITEIEAVAKAPDHITLYGKLEDKFGDNGVVSVVYGHQKNSVFFIDLWLMSCRVLKRDMEFAMMDVLVKRCLERDITQIRGFFNPTAKNRMVKDFYAIQGFEKVLEDSSGNSEWKLNLTKEYKNKNNVIQIEE